MAWFSLAAFGEQFEKFQMREKAYVRAQVIELR
jgi:hypothetical protein